MVVVEKQPIKISFIVAFVLLLLLSLIALKQCTDSRVLHDTQKVIKTTQQVYTTYSDIKFAWTVTDKILQFSKKKENVEDETQQTEQVKDTETEATTENTKESEKEDKWQDKKRSGKNEPHKNQDVKKMLEKQLEEAKARLNELENLKPKDKFEGIGKEKDRLRGLIRKISEKINEKGETHSRKSKGFK